jgi:hypothetical protein
MTPCQAQACSAGRKRCPCPDACRIAEMSEDQPASKGTTYFLISVMLAGCAALAGIFIADSDTLWRVLALLS